MRKYLRYAQYAWGKVRFKRSCVICTWPFEVKPAHYVEGVGEMVGGVLCEECWAASSPATRSIHLIAALEGKKRQIAVADDFAPADHASDPTTLRSVRDHHRAQYYEAEALLQRVRELASN